MVKTIKWDGKAPLPDGEYTVIKHVVWTGLGEARQEFTLQKTSKAEAETLERIMEQNELQRVKELHKSLDQLLAEYITDTTKLPSRSTIMELIEWSFERCKKLELELKK